MERVDRAEDELYGQRRGDELPPELSTRKHRLEAIRRAKAELEAEARDKARQEQDQRKQQADRCGKEYRPKRDADKVKPAPKAQRNFTDPESRIMRDADKAYIQGYNAQATVNAETHVIVAANLGGPVTAHTWRTRRSPAHFHSAPPCLRPFSSLPPSAGHARTASPTDAAQNARVPAWIILKAVHGPDGITM